MPRDRSSVLDEEPEDEEEEETASEAAGSSTGEPDPTPDAGDGSEADESSDDPVNIREAWDSNTYYVKPELKDTLEDEYRRLKREMRREEDITVEKFRHFFRAVLTVSLKDNPEEVRKEARKLAEQDQ